MKKDLTPSYKSRSSALRARAFTLAETLIVLAIIGVVASLTIPAVIKSSTQDQYVAGLKKANAMLNQLMEASVMQNGPVKDWDGSGVSGSSPYTTEAFFQKYFLPYLDVNQDCGTDPDGGCFARSSGDAHVYRNLTTRGEPCITMDSNDSYYKVILADGMSLAYSNRCYTPTGCTDLGARAGVIYIDVNGPKEPNLCGRDMFLFEVYPYTNNIKPAEVYASSLPYDQDLKLRRVHNGALNCDTNRTEGCAAKIFREGGMNY